MLTPQEVSARSFTKAVMGGYNMTMVDEFLDELTDDYTSLYKENASLKAKLKVLVEKVEEYRATEDSMRVTLLAAQRMAESIVQEAREKAEEIKSQADRSAQEQIEEGRRELARTEQQLREGKLALQRFISDGKQICGQAMEFLEKLPEYAPGEESAPVEQIEKNVMDAALSAQPSEAAPASAKPESPASAPAVLVEAAAKKAAVFAASPKPAAGPVATPEPKPPASFPTTKISVPVTAAPEPTREAASKADTAVPEPSAAEPDPGLEATRRVNLNELKFGPNYRGDAR